MFLRIPDKERERKRPGDGGGGAGGWGGGEKDQMMNLPKPCKYASVSGIQERKTKKCLLPIRLIAASLQKRCGSLSISAITSKQE